ncbi:MAG: translation initiation factor eIF-2B [Patescibacteria group bacterium]
MLTKVYQDIKSLKVQGATAVARTIISTLGKYGVGDKAKNLTIWQKDLKKAANYLLSARPTEPMAQNGVKFIFSELRLAKPKNIEQANNYFKKAVNDFLILMEDAAQLIIPIGQTVIKNGDNVLTHCHSWLVEQILIAAKKSNKNFHVFNTETRPLFQGRITSRKLLKAKIKTTMVTDSSAGFLISQYSGKELMMNKIILGADAILENGSVINKIGSYGIAAAAQHERTSVYIAASLLKFYPKSWIKIEERSAKEIWSNAPKKLKIINFAFDLVPAKWINGIICEAGIIRPENIKKIVKKIYPWIYD